MTKKKREQPVPQRLNRNECAANVVREFLAAGIESTLEELAERADQLFIACTPKAAPNQELASWGVKTQLEVLENLGLIRMVEECHVYILTNGGHQ
jgi:hypothetical protein